MELFWDILISALLVIGGIFGLVGSFGLVKLPDPMTRLHAPTKAATLGVGAILIASMVWFAVKQGHLTLHELMVTIFIFLTAPITAHFISKANIFRDWPAEKLPRPAGEGDWAVHTADADTSKGELAVEREKNIPHEND
ncbi:Na+/H+ antiporter subunit G [Thioclava sp. F28-4]|uniref:Na+/H+ antiporter subunit G n=1 Tax=Thioclava sp. F28-4 TaxID=1915315 RepID=UPI000995EE79|nr:Na+/H+ antiporter subunit G [Thioclava sp. F28-4]OOY04438.1 Na+/H+ antiporter subunit G [Thioclava sp. F28-4]